VAMAFRCVGIEAGKAKVGMVWSSVRVRYMELRQVQGSVGNKGSRGTGAVVLREGGWMDHCVESIAVLGAELKLCGYQDGKVKIVVTCLHT
jgi:hypothetical protein